MRACKLFQPGTLNSSYCVDDVDTIELEHTEGSQPVILLRELVDISAEMAQFRPSPVDIIQVDRKT